MVGRSFREQMHLLKFVVALKRAGGFKEQVHLGACRRIGVLMWRFYHPLMWVLVLKLEGTALYLPVQVVSCLFYELDLGHYKLCDVLNIHFQPKKSVFSITYWS